MVQKEGDDDDYFIEEEVKIEIPQNQLYACGLNEWRQNLLGEKSGREPVLEPKTPVFSEPIDNDTIVSVSLGAEFSLVLMESGRCFVGGLSAYGQLGIYPRDDCSLINISKRFELVHTMSHLKVVQISCGDAHTCFLTDTGRIFICGQNEYKQISQSGRGVYLPVEIHLADIFIGLEEHGDEVVIEVVAGGWHTMFLTNCGNVYARGELFENATSESEYIRLNQGFRVARVSGGYFFSVMLDTSGDLWLFNPKSALKRIEVSGNVISFSCKNHYFAVLNDKSEIQIFHCDGSVVECINVTGNDIPQTQQAIDVALTSSYIAVVYTRGYVHFIDRECVGQIMVSEWMKTVSIPRASLAGINLVVANGRNHFMLYWKRTSRQYLEEYWANLNTLRDTNQFCDIKVHTRL